MATRSLFIIMEGWHLIGSKQRWRFDSKIRHMITEMKMVN